MFANMACQSIEVIEAEQPLQVSEYEFLPDRAGPGKFRGGAPYCREYRFVEKDAVLQVRSDRRSVLPYGLYGGQPGRPSNNILNPGPEALPLDSKLTMNIKYGDVFRHELAGGGGWGNPLERSIDKVVLDVRDGYVSLEGARRDYGVCIDNETGLADEEKTKSVRSEMAEKFHEVSTKVKQPRPSDALERECIGENKS